MLIRKSYASMRRFELKRGRIVGSDSAGLKRIREIPVKVGGVHAYVYTPKDGINSKNKKQRAGLFAAGSGRLL